MDTKTHSQIRLFNPWLENTTPILAMAHYIDRIQLPVLLNPEWDKLVTILVGPRQAGKTTLGKCLAQTLIQTGRFTQLVYLNCDSPLIRSWLTGIHILEDIKQEIGVENYILFIDEVQRLENPGLLLKSLIDLGLPIKIIASGSSQIEIRSQVQEYLTGRHFQATILPLSFIELKKMAMLERYLIYGCYPQILQSSQQKRLLMLLYQTYINKDIIEILKIGMPAVLEKLMILIAHASGQLININKFASDCQVSVTTVNTYLDILHKTYVIAPVSAFVGNKRAEVKSAKKCYFLDNGFRNQALGDFAAVENRGDKGLLVESAVFQELYKYKTQHFMGFAIYYWRTKSGAEVDFVLKVNVNTLYPVEVKYQNLQAPTLSRSFRSFLQAYQPSQGVIITIDYEAEMTVDNTRVKFIPLHNIRSLFAWLSGLE